MWLDVTGCLPAQVIFFDKTEAVLSSKLHTVTYVDKRGQALRLHIALPAEQPTTPAYRPQKASIDRLTQAPPTPVREEQVVPNNGTIAPRMTVDIGLMELPIMGSTPLTSVDYSLFYSYRQMQNSKPLLLSCYCERFLWSWVWLVKD